MQSVQALEYVLIIINKYVLNFLSIRLGQWMQRSFIEKNLFNMRLDSQKWKRKFFYLQYLQVD